MKKVWFLLLLIVIGFCSCIFKEKEITASRVRIETTRGEIVIELNDQAAPQTVANFLSYVREGYYNSTIFHRVIKDFMIQGGGFTADMRPKSTNPPIENEADNGLKNTMGTIAMARTSNPHSATAQFFINVKNNAFLDHRGKNTQDWGYCVFGRVIQGMETLRAIENSPTGPRAGHNDVPIEPITIIQATVLDK
jgi:peptidyl-prolyl cis-trans isomerase B (cyclophilin B)